LSVVKVNGTFAGTAGGAAGAVGVTAFEAGDATEVPFDPRATTVTV